MQISQIDQRVAFFWENNAIFSDDLWNAVINFDLTQCSLMIMMTLEADLQVAKETAEQTTSIEELRPIVETMRYLNDKLDWI
jgi:hypothetical protein